MGSFDLLIVLVLAAFPLLMIGIAAYDWWRTKRLRLLLLVPFYIWFGLVAVGGFLQAESQTGIAACGGGIVALVVVSLIHARMRRSNLTTVQTTSSDNSSQ